LDAKEGKDSSSTRLMQDKAFRGLKILGAFNGSLVRVASVSELCSSLCEIVVEEGGYVFAWVGFAEHDGRKSVRVAGKAGHDAGYSDRADISWADTERGNGPTGRCIREGRPVVARFLESEENYTPWRGHALERGYRSSAALPLFRDGQVVGALNIYSGEPDDFSSTDVDMLSEVALSLSNGISAIKNRTQTQNIFQAIGHPALILDKAHHIFSANNAALELLGMNEGEIFGKHCYELFHQSFSPPEGCPHQKMLKSGKFEKTEMEIEVLDRVFLVSCTPVFNEEGGLDHIIHIATDTTDQNRAEKELKESELRYRELVENQPAIICKLDPGGKTRFVNPRIEEITGYGADELTGRNWWETFYPDEGREVVDELYRRFGHGDVKGFEMELCTKHGSRRTIIWDSFNQWDENGELVEIKGSGIDVTDRKRLEDQLNHSQKMESLGRLAGGVAHDFNNQLSVIMSISEVLSRELASQGGLKEDIDLIRNAADKSAALTRQLLTFSRKEVVKPKVLNVNEAISGTEKILGKVLGEDIKLEVRPGENVADIKMDHGHLEQIIMNLAVNARDAMPRGGKLLIETANAALDREYTDSHALVKPGAYVMIVISDTGEGIDKETLEYIFEPFFTTKDKGQGTGLGLSTVYGIVERAGGHIRVYSEPGHGTTFRIYLPLEDEEKREMEEAPKLRGLPAGSETILVVEDDDMVRETIVRLLSISGHEVIEAESGEQGLEKLEQNKDRVAVIISDVVMPGISGKELAERVLEQNPGIKIILTSGYPDMTVAFHEALDERFLLLQKPFTADELFERVEEALK